MPFKSKQDLYAKISVLIGWKAGKNITETKKFKTENSFWQNIIILSQGFVMEDNEEFL